MNRKNFIKTCGFACMGGTTMSMLFSGCTSDYFAQMTTLKNQLVVKKSEFVKIVKDKKTERKYVLVQTDKMKYPIYIFKFDDDTYSALLMECSHRSCELHTHGEYLVCPCHGSEFSNKGVVQNPPAEQNLQSFKITTDDENIYIFI